MRGAPQSAPAANEVEAQWICKLRTIVPCIRFVVCDTNTTRMLILLQLYNVLGLAHLLL